METSRNCRGVLRSFAFSPELARCHLALYHRGVCGTASFAYYLSAHGTPPRQRSQKGMIQSCQLEQATDVLPLH